MSVFVDEVLSGLFPSKREDYEQKIWSNFDHQFDVEELVLNETEYNSTLDLTYAFVESDNFMDNMALASVKYTIKLGAQLSDLKATLTQDGTTNTILQLTLILVLHCYVMPYIYSKLHRWLFTLVQAIYSNKLEANGKLVKVVSVTKSALFEVYSVNKAFLIVMRFKINVLAGSLMKELVVLSSKYIQAFKKGMSIFKSEAILNANCSYDYTDIIDCYRSETEIGNHDQVESFVETTENCAFSSSPHTQLSSIIFKPYTSQETLPNSSPPKVNTINNSVATTLQKQGINNVQKKLQDSSRTITPFNQNLSLLLNHNKLEASSDGKPFLISTDIETEFKSYFCSLGDIKCKGWEYFPNIHTIINISKLGIYYLDNYLIEHYPLAYTTFQAEHEIESVKPTKQEICEMLNYFEPNHPEKFYDCNNVVGLKLFRSYLGYKAFHSSFWQIIIDNSEFVHALLIDENVSQVNRLELFKILYDGFTDAGDNDVTVNFTHKIILGMMERMGVSKLTGGKEYQEAILTTVAIINCLSVEDMNQYLLETIYYDILSIFPRETFNDFKTLSELGCNQIMYAYMEVIKLDILKRGNALINLKDSQRFIKFTEGVSFNMSKIIKDCTFLNTKSIELSFAWSWLMNKKEEKICKSVSERKSLVLHDNEYEKLELD